MTQSDRNGSNFTVEWSGQYFTFNNVNYSNPIEIQSFMLELRQTPLDTCCVLKSALDFKGSEQVHNNYCNFEE